MLVRAWKLVGLSQPSAELAKEIDPRAQTRTRRHSPPRRTHPTTPRTKNGWKAPLISPRRRLDSIPERPTPRESDACEWHSILSRVSWDRPSHPVSRTPRNSVPQNSLFSTTTRLFPVAGKSQWGAQSVCRREGVFSSCDSGVLSRKLAWRVRVAT